MAAYLGSPVAGASTNQAGSGLSALAGSVRHLRGGRVSLTALAVVGIPSALGAVAGMPLFVKVNRLWAHIILGLLLLIPGIRMARRPAASPASASPPGWFRLVGEIRIGLFLGALAAVTALMMNGLRLPGLVRQLQGNVVVAVGTNMAIGLLTALVGAGAAWAVGNGFDLVALAVVGPPTVLGSCLGAAVTGRLSKEAVQRALGWLIVFSAC